jgi:hypothetical protein
MSILSVQKYSVRPERLPIWEKGLTQIAERAGEQQHPLSWRTSQVIGGELGTFYISTPGDSVAEVAGRESAAELITGLFGRSQGERLRSELGQSLQSSIASIHRDRAELSYPADQAAEPPAGAVVTTIIVRPGWQEACEELIRYVAEAIPKAGDNRRFTTYQPVIGNLRSLASVRPVFDLEELDEMIAVPELLKRAFGAEQGTQIYRSGTDSIEDIQSELLLMRPEMSRLEI